MARAQSSLRRTSRLDGASAAACLGLILGLAASISPAEADKVGVAAAVNPDAFSSLSGSERTQLNIGKSIFFNERINTTGKGLVQVLLIDGSTFTVGPGSDLVIDKFVYDPNKKAGTIVASFSKGAMRFVGGKISKNDESVTVNTPAGALAIRGGMFQGSVNGGKGVFSFLYGVNMTLTGKNGQSYTVFQPGNTIDATGTTPTVRATTPSDVNSIMAALTNGNTGGTGTPGGTGTGTQPGSKYTAVETLSLQDLISDATADQIQGQLDKEQGAPPTDPNNPPPTDTTDNPPPPDPTDNPPPLPTDTKNPPPKTTTPPPVPLTVRVLNAPGVYTAFPTTPGATYTTDNTAGILGGDPNSTDDDLIHTFSIVNDRIVGTVSGMTDDHLECPSGPSSCHSVVTHPSPVSVDFPAKLTGCVGGVCPVTDAKLTQDGVTKNLTGIAVLKSDFFAYQLIGAQGSGQGSLGPSGNPLLAFGGTGYKFGAPTGREWIFQPTADITQLGAVGPFASAASAPSNISPDPNSNSPLLLLEKDSNPLSHSVWIQSSFYLGGSGETQQSFVNVALGEWDPTTGLFGVRRGGSDVDHGPNGEALRQTYSFSGDIASLSGPDGAHFLGSGTPNVVVGADSTGSHNIFRDQPLNSIPTVNDTPANQSGATYHVGIGLGAATPQAQTLTDMHGYAAGLMAQPGSSAPQAVFNTAPAGVTIHFDPVANTLGAQIQAVGVDSLVQSTSYTLAFGGDKRSAYIDDRIFAAVENPGASQVTEQRLFSRPTTYIPTVQGYVVSSDALNANHFLFAGQTVGDAQKQAFCQDCGFLKWGAWGARLDYTKQNAPVTKEVNLGWWIAGQVTDNQLLPRGMTATYNGDAIGNVTRQGTNGLVQYVATGGLAMDWNFDKRLGTLAITAFDPSVQAGGLSFSGPIKAPINVNQFGGVMAGSGLVGANTGSFVTGGPPVLGGTGLNPAGGVIGNWNAAGLVNARAYQATGIFGGIQTSATAIPHND